MKTRKRISLYLGYQNVIYPWGGANTFLKALYDYIKSDHEFEIHDQINSKTDIFFLNQFNKGPGSNRKSNWTLSEIFKIKKDFSEIKIIVRAVDLKTNPFENHKIKRSFLSDLYQDRALIKLINMADKTVFQSQFSLESFTRAGYNINNSYSVIRNFANSEFSQNRYKSRFIKNKIIILSNSFAPKNKKNLELVAALSLLDSIQVNHIGNWPTHINPHRINLLGIKDTTGIINIMMRSHFLFHPASFDVCPNSVIEALSLGLPVVGINTPGGTKEILNDYALGLILEKKQLDLTLFHRLKSFYNLLFESNQFDTTQHKSLNNRGAYKELFKSVLERY